MPTRSKPIVSWMSMRLGDRDLGADAVGGGGQQRLVVARQRGGVEQPGEAADAADHLGAAGLLDPDLHQLDGLVAGLDVDAGGGVRVGLRGCGGLLGHGRAPLRSGVVEHGQRLGRRAATSSDASSRCLPSRLSSGSSIGYSPVKQARQRLSARLAGGLDHARRARCSRGSRRRRWRRSRRRRGRWRSARRGWRSRCRRSTATSPAGWRSARAPRRRRPRGASGPGRAGCCRARSSRRRRRAACRGSCARGR